jgi:hypothetical protein
MPTKIPPPLDLKRKPIFGILPPKGKVTVAVDPPVEAKHQPVGLTAHAGDISLRDMTAKSVTVVNLTDRIVPYCVLIVPSGYVHAATVPWGRVLADVADAVKQTGLPQLLGQIFRGKR